MAAPRRDSVQVLRVQLRSPVLIPTLVVVLALRHHLALQDVIQVLRAIRGKRDLELFHSDNKKKKKIVQKKTIYMCLLEIGRGVAMT